MSGLIGAGWECQRRHGVKIIGGGKEIDVIVIDYPSSEDFFGEAILELRGVIGKSRIHLTLEDNSCKLSENLSVRYDGYFSVGHGQGRRARLFFNFDRSYRLNGRSYTK